MNTLARLLRKIPCLFGYHHYEFVDARKELRICCKYCGLDATETS